jgi:hypothetical protein
MLTFHNKTVHIQIGSIHIETKKKTNSDFSIILFAYLVSSVVGNEDVKAVMLFKLRQIVNLFL